MQAFILIMLLVFAAGLVDFGGYYNRAVDWLSLKTGGAVVLPKTKVFPFRLGLDLQGGTHLVYEADMSQIDPVDRQNALEGVRDVIERRVNAFGVSEPVVQTNRTAAGEYQVIVELAGIKDVNQAIKMIGETPLLEFKEPASGPPKLTPEEQKKLDEFNRQAEKKAQEVLGKALKGGDFAALARQYSDDEATKDKGGDLGWVTEADKPDLVSAAKKLKPGQVSDLIATADGDEIIKLENKRVKKDPFSGEPEKEVKAAHILICYQGAENCQSNLSKEEAYRKIKEIKAKANPQNFKQLARQYSTDPTAKQNGGELGWFGRGKMVKPFEDTVFKQKVGTISYIVETKFGYHIIYKEAERPIEEYKLRHIFIRKMKPADIIGNKPNWKNTELTGKYLKRATVQFDPKTGAPQVALEFDSEGAKLFADITGRNVGKQVAIFLDGYVISAPTVNEKITGGKAVISGKFNLKEAKLLARRLNEGALPVPIKLVSQQTVGASLGHQSVQDSLRAGLIGLILVALFMIIFYRLPGLISVLSLLVYGFLVMAIFKLWPVTLTLAGVAGFILSIGMAVDANVLIFERLKEELAAGKPVSIAIEEAFLRAWPSIRDGNVSTLITCFILIQFSTSIVKGFAITLGIGVLVSMFSAIIVTKNFMMMIGEDRLAKFPRLLGAKKVSS